jgi:hypothetical protein
MGWLGQSILQSIGQVHCYGAIVAYYVWHKYVKLHLPMAARFVCFQFDTGTYNLTAQYITCRVSSCKGFGVMSYSSNYIQ